MDENNLKRIPVPLVTAEATFTVVVAEQGKDANVVIEVTPARFTGNTPGLQYSTMMRWRDAAQFAVALRRVAQRMRQGEGVVEGQSYGRVPLELPGFATIHIFLTPDDCDTMSMALQGGIDYARKQPFIVSRR